MSEPAAKQLGLADLPHQRAHWIELLVANPTLIQRPIILHDDTATVARTPEALRQALQR